jgi:hypothetical protein
MRKREIAKRIFFRYKKVKYEPSRGLYQRMGVSLLWSPNPGTLTRGRWLRVGGKIVPKEIYPLPSFLPSTGGYLTRYPFLLARVRVKIFKSVLNYYLPIISPFHVLKWIMLPYIYRGLIRNFHNWRSSWAASFCALVSLKIGRRSSFDRNEIANRFWLTNVLTN